MSHYNISIDQFSGPLDLLLHLIRGAEMDIFELDVAAITEDYLAFIEREGVKDLAGAYHFLAMAASLVELKSRMLLPQQPKEGGDEDEEEMLDPRQELIHRLAAYEGIQQVTQELESRYEQMGHHWPRQFVEKLEAEIVYTMDNLNVYDLMTAFSEVLEKPRFKQITIFKEDYDTEEARGWVRARLRSGQASLKEILMEQRDVFVLIVTFISILEMIKEDEAVFEREEDEIIIKLNQQEL